MWAMPALSRPAVAARGLHLRFGDSTALGPSDFEIPAGQVTAVIGPNGSGKSTLLNAIAGLHPPAGGTLAVLGGDPPATRRRVALVLQATKVNEELPVTVREVVAMGRFAALGFFGRFRRADREAVDEALRRLDLAEAAGRHLGELSGGQRQRVFVAQGLVQTRDLLLMDEPLTGLDLVSAAVIAAVVREERAAGRTVVVTTHDLAEADRADHVLLLAGVVAASGPPADVLTPLRLSAAYGANIVDVGGRLLVDDAAHWPADRRHTHLDRSATTHPHDG